MNEYLEYESLGGPEGIDAVMEAAYWASQGNIEDEDGEIAYERMLSDRASWETELDARHGM